MSEPKPMRKTTARPVADDAPEATELLRAFANPIRLRLLGLLWSAEQDGDGEVCVCDLVAVLGVPQPTASRHLALLRDAGLASCRKDGAWCHYRLCPPRDAVHRGLLATLEAAVLGDARLGDDAARLRLGCGSAPGRVGC